MVERERMACACCLTDSSSPSPMAAIPAVVAIHSVKPATHIRKMNVIQVIYCFKKLPELVGAVFGRCIAAIGDGVDEYGFPRFF